MEIEKKHKKMIEILEDLDRLFREQLSKENSISYIDIDLALQKTRDLYNLLLQLKTSHPLKDSKHKPDEQKTTELTSTFVEEDIQESETDPSEIETSEIVPMETISDKNEASKPHKTKKEEPDLFTTSPSDSQSQKVIRDKKQDTIGDVISETRPQETISDKIQKDKIKSLKVAIGINDKFYFINELFDGSLNDYSKVIDDLDALSSYDEAKKYLEDQLTNRNWDPKSEAVMQIMGFVERKYH
ncbi:MAG: hypothetical protein KQI35_13290 [Bacteroidetes bacterium]|nr:hypothetical protein [Bacteroidota bacterium]